MQFCESQVVSMSTKSGDDLKLDFLLEYNLRRRLFRSACEDQIQNALKSKQPIWLLYIL